MENNCSFLKFVEKLVRSVKKQSFKKIVHERTRLFERFKIVLPTFVFSERHHHSRKQMFVQHEYVHANKEYLLHR